MNRTLHNTTRVCGRWGPSKALVQTGPITRFVRVALTRRNIALKHTQAGRSTTDHATVSKERFELGQDHTLAFSFHFAKLEK